MKVSWQKNVVTVGGCIAGQHTGEGLKEFIDKKGSGNSSSESLAGAE